MLRPRIPPTASVYTGALYCVHFQHDLPADSFIFTLKRHDAGKTIQRFMEFMGGLLFPICPSGNIGSLVFAFLKLIKSECLLCFNLKSSRRSGFSISPIFLRNHLIQIIHRAWFSSTFCKRVDLCSVVKAEQVRGLPHCCFFFPRLLIPYRSHLNSRFDFCCLNMVRS